MPAARAALQNRRDTSIQQWLAAHVRTSSANSTEANAPMSRASSSSTGSRDREKWRHMGASGAAEITMIRSREIQRFGANSSALDAIEHGNPSQVGSTESRSLRGRTVLCADCRLRNS